MFCSYACGNFHNESDIDLQVVIDKVKNPYKEIDRISDLHINHLIKLNSMFIDHIALYSNKLEELMEFYIKYFGGIPNTMYFNEKKQFSSYFLTFESGARLELMSMPGIPENKNDTVLQHTGLIHIAFGVDRREEVDKKALQLANNGFRILDGPRQTGDGYYEFVTLDPDGNRVEVTSKLE